MARPPLAQTSTIGNILDANRSKRGVLNAAGADFALFSPYRLR